MSHPLEAKLQALENFEVWLNQYDGRKTAGYARTDCDCPLANFLKEAWDRRIAVRCNGLQVGDGFAYHTTLSYAFTREIDDGRGNREKVSFASAKKALLLARRSLTLGRH